MRIKIKKEINRNEKTYAFFIHTQINIIKTKDIYMDISIVAVSTKRSSEQVVETTKMSLLPSNVWCLVLNPTIHIMYLNH